LQAAINEYFPYLPSFFGGSKSKNNEIFRSGNSAAHNDEMPRIMSARRVTIKYGLTCGVRQAA